MKFFHISDLHIGKQLYGYSLAEDQTYVLWQVISALGTEKPDALLIAGDIYDKPVPSGEAVSLFDAFLTEVTYVCPQMPILLIAGNHDSAGRIDYAGNILRRQNIHIVGSPPKKEDQYMRKLTLGDEYGETDIYILPFFKPGQIRGVFSPEENESYVNSAKETGVSEYEIYFEKLLAREQIDETKRNVLLTHQFFVPEDGSSVDRTESEVITVGTLDHISAKHLKPFDYVAMGHIHRAQKCGQERYRYCGTLMPYSLSEETDRKSITVVTLREKDQEPQIDTIPLDPLRHVRKLTGTKAELMMQAQVLVRERRMQDDRISQSDRISQEGQQCGDYVSLVVTDEDPGRFVREELGEYFSRILEIRYDNRFMRELIGENGDAVLAKDYVHMFEQFYEMRNGCAMSGEEKRILSKMLDGAKEETI